ncbi:MAG: LON peptidase substrate-binding domain-containing protein [Pyrinomonadaceae bacterium]
MSDALEKVTGLTHLPIFPLPLVMLPNELLPLHIFEERYQQMLRDIEHQRNLFGITLFDPVESFIEKPAAGTVGCVAEIRESEILEDGRSNILTLGIVRYRLIDYIDVGDEYLVGNVEFFEDTDDDRGEVNSVADEVFALFERMAKAAFKMSGNRGSFPEIIRTGPEALSFLITAAFNFDNEKKYRLLEMTSTIDRLTELKTILLQTVGQIEESAQIQSVSRTNGHSKKKLDL